MIASLFERIEEWSWRLYRMEPERLRREAALRGLLLRRLLIATGAVCVLYVVLEWAGVVANVAFPYDLAELLLAIVLCRWLLARGQASSATVILLVVISHPAAFAIGQYGVTGPAPALLIPSLLVCGLLVGGYFQSTWTGICCGLLLWTTYRAGTLGDPASVPALVFWWMLFVAVGWLVFLFSDHLERRWQVEHRQGHALGRMLAVLAAEQPLDGLLERVAGLLRDEFDAAAVTLARYDAAADRLLLVAIAREGEPIREAAASIPSESLPAWQEVSDSRQGVRIQRPAADGRVTGWPVLFSPRSEQLLLVPIVIGTTPAGFLAVDRILQPRDAQEDSDLAQILARELALFFQVEQLARSQRQAAVLEERYRMAREIHDSLAQGFTGIVVQLNAAEEMLSRQADTARQHIAAARSLARSSLDEARRSVRALRPRLLDRYDLPAALAQIAGELAPDGHSRIDFQVAGQARTLPAGIELDVLRIGQEALTNAVRHARCDRILVTLTYEAAALRLEVCDNGSGDLSAGAVPSNGSGLPGMAERARRLGGQLRVDGQPGVGTCVLLSVPLR